MTNQEQQEQFLREELQKSNAISAMIATEGWRILEDHFHNRLELIEEHLTMAKPEEIIILQARHYALKCMLDAAQQYVAMRHAFERELQELAEDRQLRLVNGY